jgi:hypothetical protein
METNLWLWMLGLWCGTPLGSLVSYGPLVHLQAHAPTLVVQYLEHIITKWGNTTPEFHNRLLQVYLEQVFKPMKAYLDSLQGSRPAPAGWFRPVPSRSKRAMPPFGTPQ